MHHFKYRDSELYCEDVPVREIAARIGTPFYLYSHATLKRHFQVFNQAFDGIEKLICYSAKANTNLAVLKLFADLGCGLDIVSGGELYRGLRAGFPPERIVYSGVGKTVEEIDYALDTGILMFNVESHAELEQINRRAGKLKKRAPVSIRINPDVDPKTHPYTATGLKKNKFGIGFDVALDSYQFAAKLENLDVVGVDCHIGSQITEAGPFQEALQNLKGLINALKAGGTNIRYLDMGVTYADEKPPSLAEYAGVIISQLKDMEIQLVLEPGRVLVGNAGILVTEVLYRKSGEVKNFVIVDAGMNDLLRPMSSWPMSSAQFVKAATF